MSLAAAVALVGCGEAKEAVTATETVTTVSVSEVTVTETVTTGVEEPAADQERPQRISVSSMDEIYGEVIRGYGVDITDAQVAEVGPPVCDSYDAGGGYDGALAVVQETTGHTGWEATKIVQGVVVGRCSQYADQTY